MSNITEQPDYEWQSFYHGHPVQKWWKQSVARVVWDMIPESQSLLDAGCGSSPISSHYPKATAVDVDAEKLAFLKRVCPKITTKVMSVCKLEFPEKSFDHVLLIEVIEHLPVPRLAIEGVARVLKPYGKVVIATPDYSRWHWLLAERFTPYKDGHIHRFTRKTLEMLCARYKLMPVRHEFVAACDLVELFEKK